MHWMVVKFPKEQTVEVVPSSWYLRELKMCYWPPTNTKRLKISNLIKSRDDPQPDWILYNAELLGEYSKCINNLILRYLILNIFSL